MQGNLTSSFSKSSLSLLMAGAVVLVGLASPVYVLAQEDDTIIEEVIVTGSRIPRQDLEALSPLVVIDSIDIDISGTNHVASILNELTSSGIPGSVDTATNFRTQTVGVNTPDLRNLGSQRTLVLVNGRRHIGGIAGTSTVDVSMIPSALVERIEIVTGGASAIYGSEATAGVINFAYKKNFQGLEISSRYGVAFEGGARETDLNLLAGLNFGAEDRGNAVVYLGYSDRGILESKDRAISAADATNSSFGPKGSFQGSRLNADDARVPVGGFITRDDDGMYSKSFVNAEDGFNRNAVRLIRVPVQRVLFATNLIYKFSDSLNFFSESSFSHLESSNRLEPTIVGQFISIGEESNLNLPDDNPFIPDELRPSFTVAAVPAVPADPANPDDMGTPAVPERTHTPGQPITFRKRFTELGPRAVTLQRRVFRTALGVDGSINDLNYEAYYQYGSFVQNQTGTGVFNALNFRNALDAEPNPLATADNVGTVARFRCQDALARALGCVPINLFEGADSIGGDELAYVSVIPQSTTRMRQQVFAISANTPLFELPAGSAATAFGFEYRKEISDFFSDSLAQSGLTSGNTTPNVSGSYNIKEFFTEIRMPILSGRPGVEYLGFETALRYADYSTIGGAFSGTAAIDYRPIEGLKIRASLSTAVRAPNIGELFDPGSETFRSFVDPCGLGGQGGISGTGVPNDLYPEQTEAAQANCLSIPGIDATFDPISTDNLRSAGGLSAGNPDLIEESSDAFTFGVVWTPSGGSGLNFTLDYYKIKITDAIAAFSAQTTVDQCIRQPDFPNNPFCSLIERNSATGIVDRINALAINVSELESEGIDFAIEYLGEVGPGTLSLDLAGTIGLTLDSLPFEGGEVIHDQGSIGAPDLKMNFHAGYEARGFAFNWSVRYIHKVNLDNLQPSAGTVAAAVYNDIQARYTFRDNYEFFGGIDNVFDKQPPFLGQGVTGDITGTNTAADIYDAIRTFGYVGVRLKF